MHDMKTKYGFLSSPKRRSRKTSGSTDAWRDRLKAKHSLQPATAAAAASAAAVATAAAPAGGVAAAARAGAAPAVDR